MRYAIITGGKVVGCVNWDGSSRHPFGDVELRALPEGATAIEWVGKPATEIPEAGSPIASAAELVALAPKEPFVKAMGSDDEFIPPKTAAEAIQREADDGDADPEGTARLNYPELFEDEAAEAFAKFDHDGDGKPGGSRPKPKAESERIELAPRKPFIGAAGSLKTEPVKRKPGRPRKNK